ncbi:SEC13, partial [Symbiodinium microadriaticum]
NCSIIQNDSLGCNTVSWAPFSALGSLEDSGRSIKRLVTGSCDNSVRMWKQQDAASGGSWVEEDKLPCPHT